MSTTNHADSNSKSSRARGRKANKSSSSKADIARSIFTKLHGKHKSRKEIVEAFVSEAKLTPAGASTYYQRFTSHGNHVKARGRASNQTSLRHARSGRPRGRPIDDDSKAGKARAIWRKFGSKKSRKEILEIFQKEAKLTPAGSSTYYQKLKNAA